tara:strand:- start:829 stop:1914 length:1086 start_codon:yes stop_codon:yes gene_type:complete
MLYFFIFASDEPKPVETANLSLLNLLSNNSTVIEGEIPQPDKDILLPQDHYDHPNFRNEWWYFTGNLKDKNQQEFGYQFTIFRFKNDEDNSNSLWSASDIYLGHLAITDIANSEYLHKEIYFRKSDLGLAGSDKDNNKIWISNWMLEFDGNDVHLSARQDEIILDLTLKSRSIPILHGKQGYSKKGADPSNASYYYSITDYETTGKISIDKTVYEVTGNSWYDHEWSSGVLPENVIGWDWFSINLNEGSQLMIYQLRNINDVATPYSAGTFIDENNKVINLNQDQFQLRPIKYWESESTKINYPLEWEIKIPELGINLLTVPKINKQEFNGSIIYWEGAIDVANSSNDSLGEGYMELTGYN